LPLVFFARPGQKQSWKMDAAGLDGWHPVFTETTQE
jgi:hypothetical protein